MGSNSSFHIHLLHTVQYMKPPSAEPSLRDTQHGDPTSNTPGPPAQPRTVSCGCGPAVSGGVAEKWASCSPAMLSCPGAHLGLGRGNCPWTTALPMYSLTLCDPGQVTRPHHASAVKRQ